MAQLQLTDSSFEKEVLQTNVPVLVDFWAPWCGPCRMIAPILDEISKEYGEKVKIAKLNTDENQGAAARYKISAIPTLLFFKNGKVIDQMVGVHSKNEIKKRLDQSLTLS